MAKTTSEKLAVKDHMTLLSINAPEDFLISLGKLPESVRVTAQSKSYHQIHWFVKNRAQMEKEVSKVIALMKEEVICWIYFPKGSSGIQTDLTRDKGWEKLMENDLHWINLISFDDTWSAFGMRLKTDKDRQQEGKTKVREIFNYIDTEKRTIRLPIELDKAFRKNAKAKSYFDALSFTNKKEYVEWIVSAKKEETRDQRIAGTIERLTKGWKNPNNQGGKT